MLFSRRFGPLMATQALSAFNDNLFRTAMTFLIGYELLSDDPAAAASLATIAAGVFILPFVLFSGIAGELADTRDKAAVARAFRFLEIPTLAAGAWAIHAGSIPAMMAVLFVTGFNSTFLGPIKYAILPQHLARSEVLRGTAWVEAGTFIAILLGQVAGGLVGRSGAAFAVVAVAVACWLCSLRIPAAPPSAARAPDLNPWTSSRKVLARLWADPTQREAMLAISWFWALGAVFTAGFVPLVADRLLAGPGVATLFLVVFSVGIAVGSFLVNRWLGGRITGRPTPLAAGLLALFGCVFYLGVAAWDGRAAGVGDFVSQAGAWWLLGGLAGLAVAGGMFIVPLYAVLQTAAGPAERAGAIAANNIVNSLYMVIASGVAATLVASGRRFGVGMAEVMLLFALLNVPVALRLRARVGLLAPQG